MREIHFDRSYHLREKGSKLGVRSLFDEENPWLQPFEQAMNDRTFNAHTIHDLEIGVLVDTTFNSIWSLAATSLLEYQGSAEYFESNVYRRSAPYAIARERARNILDIRSTILDLLERLQDELLQQNPKS